MFCALFVSFDLVFCLFHIYGTGHKSGKKMQFCHFIMRLGPCIIVQCICTKNRINLWWAWWEWEEDFIILTLEVLKKGLMHCGHSLYIIHQQKHAPIVYNFSLLITCNIEPSMRQIYVNAVSGIWVCTFCHKSGTILTQNKTKSNILADEGFSMQFVWGFWGKWLRIQIGSLL